jgi:predicted nucleotidyltransferase
LRLSKDEVEFIKNTINSILKSEIYIFGSRLDDNKKGGDLDIYLIPKEKEDLSYKVGLIRMILEERLLIPVDIVIAKDKNREIEKEALKGVKI